METLKDRVLNFVKKIFSIQEYGQSVSITRYYDYRTNALRNKMWYQGDANELQQFFQSMDEGQNTFWGQKASSRAQEIQRLHDDTPALIVDTLVNITANGLENIDFENEQEKEAFNEIMSDGEFKRILAQLTKKCLIVGDGAVKFGFDKDVSLTKPHLMVYSGDNVDYVERNGFLKEVKFYTHYNDYTLQETYGYGYIKYNLYRNNSGTTKEVPMGTIPETEGLEDVVFNSNVILAVPFKFFDSEKYEGRGKSIYEGKSDAFQGLDQTASMIAMCTGASSLPKTYIPTSLCGTDPMNGALMTPNAFDNRFYKIADDLSENAQNKITTEQPDIKINEYLSASSTFLDMALKGVISPSTLGIDVKKLDNAEAQREKEKTTLYTRAAILEHLGEIAAELIQVAFNTVDIMNNRTPKKIEVTVGFGEYANPSFEAVVEIMSNPNSPMSIEAKVEEIWGDTKDDEWKAEEVARIKKERGIIELEEPAVNNILGGMENDQNL